MFTKKKEKEKKEAVPYLETYDIGCYKYTNTLYQVPKSMYKCCSHCKAAGSLAIPKGCVRRAWWRYMAVCVRMGMKVTWLIQQKTHSERERKNKQTKKMRHFFQVFWPKTGEKIECMMPIIPLSYFVGRKRSKNHTSIQIRSQQFRHTQFKKKVQHAMN